MKENDNLSTKHWALHILIMAFSFFGIYIVGQYSKHFSANKIVAPVSVGGGLSIDILGAIVPVVIGVFSTIIFFYLKISWKKYLTFFVFSFFLNYSTGKIVPGGFFNKPLENVLFVSLIVVLVALGKNPLTETWKKLSYSFVIVLSVIPLTLFLSDFFVAPLFAEPTIGGAGLADGILVSTVYSPFVTSLIASFYVFLGELNSFLRGKLVDERKLEF